jgi:hypothetical protein
MKKIRFPDLSALGVAALAVGLCFGESAAALERPDVEFKIFQFPANAIPRIDGKTADWDIVPDTYAIGSDQLADTGMGKGANIDRASLDVKVKVGWVKGINQLYVLYEAYDNYWDFALAGRHNDIFELVVDGDLSGGPLIKDLHPYDKLDPMAAHFLFHGVHAQNYHIMTPHEGQDWAFVWGSQPWIKDLPWGNAAYSYDFKPGESGKLILEFWITPFDYAPPDPARAVVSKLEENAVIGMSWSILDYDDVNKKDYEGFWNLSHKQTMYGDASDLVAFRLMPLEERFRKGIEATWQFQVLDMNRRLVAFQDMSHGNINSWKWDFGDGETSADQHPLHSYEKAGEYVVTLYIEGAAGKARHTRVRAVAVK